MARSHSRLPVGGSYTNPVENTGCYLLLEAQYK